MRPSYRVWPNAASRRSRRLRHCTGLAETPPNETSRGGPAKGMACFLGRGMAPRDLEIDHDRKTRAQPLGAGTEASSKTALPPPAQGGPRTGRHIRGCWRQVCIVTTDIHRLAVPKRGHARPPRAIQLHRGASQGRRPPGNRQIGCARLDCTRFRCVSPVRFHSATDRNDRKSSNAPHHEDPFPGLPFWLGPVSCDRPEPESCQNDAFWRSVSGNHWHCCA